MKSRFQFKIFFILITLALTISFTIASIDHLRLKEQAVLHHQKEIIQIEENVKASISEIEKAYFLFDRDTAKKMEKNTYHLINRYKKNPNFSEWDFKRLKNLFGMDIYIINEENVIVYSSFQPDIGLDFNKCCGKLARMLNFRRAEGTFFHDGLDIEQETGALKKYSVMATPDRKYLIELGYSLQDDEIFRQYNFFEKIEELEEKYPIINQINVLHFGGNTYGQPAQKLPKERRAAFDEALSSMETVELHAPWNETNAIYRYVLHRSSYDFGPTKNKVLEIIYNDDELQAVLDKNKKVFVIELIIVIIFTFFASLIISRLIAKPMHLAFHDSLTNLKNRAAFNELAHSFFADPNKTNALFMIDLDNFKIVNDTFGHDEGDRLLKLVSQKIHALIRTRGETFRLAGDEFVIIISDTNKKEVLTIAHSIIHSINHLTETRYKKAKIEITVSIGIALSPEHGTNSMHLYKHADIALYVAKAQGKNQFSIFQYDKD